MALRVLAALAALAAFLLMAPAAPSALWTTTATRPPVTAPMTRAAGRSIPIRQGQIHAVPAYREYAALDASATSLKAPTPTALTPLAAPLLALLMAVPGAYLAGRWASRRPSSMTMAMAAGGAEPAPFAPSRRDALRTAVAFGAMGAAPALAIPAGFALHKDPYDGYEFIFPFGWQEVSMQGQDVLFKDIIEPLETIGVSIVKTDKQSIAEFGPPETVCFTIADQFLTSPSQTVKLVKAQAEEEGGIQYYTMEFTSTAPNYSRHALAVLAVCNGKLFTCVTGCSERRWRKLEKSLRTAIDSFTVVKVFRTAPVMP